MDENPIEIVMGDCSGEEDNDEVIFIEQDAATIKSLGDTCFKNGDYIRANSHYTNAIELSTDQGLTSKCYANRAACYISLEKYENALNDNEMAGQYDPNYSKKLSRFVKCKTLLGDFLSAKKALEENTSTIDPGLDRERESFNVIETNWKKGIESIQKKDYRSAVYFMEQLIKKGVIAAFCKTHKAECLMELNRLKEAEELANSVLALDKMNVEAIYVRAICLLYKDCIDESVGEFQCILKLAPDHAKAKTMWKISKNLKQKRELGNKAFGDQRYDEAYSLYTEALEIDKKNIATNSKLYFNRANAAAKLGKYHESIEDCNQAIKLNSHYLKALLRRAQNHKELENFEEAVKDYQKAYDMDSTRRNLIHLQETQMLLHKSKRKDYYKILGIEKTASSDDIRRAYHKQAKIHHPDRHANVTAEKWREEDRLFKDALEAKNVLSDPKKRQAYDNGQDIQMGQETGEDYINVFKGDFYRQYRPNMHSFPFSFN